MVRDLMINFERNMLKIQFPEIEGLKPTILQEKSNWIAQNSMYRYYMYGDYWITISSLKLDRNKIIVYDSAYFHIDEEVNAIAVATILLHGTKKGKYQSSCTDEITLYLLL